jgi:hypothetical protein
MGPDLGHRAIRMSRSRQQRHDVFLNRQQGLGALHALTPAGILPLKFGDSL